MSAPMKKHEKLDKCVFSVCADETEVTCCVKDHSFNFFVSESSVSLISSQATSDCNPVAELRQMWVYEVLCNGAGLEWVSAARKGTCGAFDLESVKFFLSGFETVLNTFLGQAEANFFLTLIEAVMPGADHLPASVSDVVSECSYWAAKNLPVVELIGTNFVEAFVKRGEVFVLSDRTEIDKHDCVALLPTGILVLHLTRETFTKLGLPGRPSQYKKVDKFVVELSLTEPDFKPGTKKYKRVRKCLSAATELTLDYLVTWTPQNDKICPSSVCKYLESRGIHCQESLLSATTTVHRDVPVPVILSQQPGGSAQSVGHHEFFEWQGALALGVDLKSEEEDDFAGLYSYPDACVIAAKCLVSRYSGFVSTDTICKLRKALRDHVSESNAPWVSLTVAGFQDSPVSWGRTEHGFHGNGDNFYSCVLFPDKYHWLYKVLGPNDRVG